MCSRNTLVGGLVFAVVAAGVAAGLGVAQAGDADSRPEPANRAGSYVVLIPQKRYQAIVVSPEPTGTGGNDSLSFTIRAREPSGRVSDFPFFVRAGDVRTLTFPEGWAPNGEALLLAPPKVNFAAWGVGMGTTATGTAAPGPLVRFEPVDRDTQKDVRDRERARDFEETLRQAERNR